MPLEPTSANDRAPVAASAPPAPIEAPIEITEDDELSDVFDDASYDFGDAEGANETAAVEKIAPVVEERSQRAQADPSRRESVQEMEASQRERPIRRSGNDVISLRWDKLTDFHKLPNLDFDLLLVAAKLLLIGFTPSAAAQRLANTIKAKIVSNGYAMEIRDK
ncbi:hypothetical protein BDV95DRAFT_557940 [Massariosphaeria phaeospora]|uniref:Uncharacterized protein n=1 Tax=Massariosphaeria phaeospora TaxID=100035 RepID=A0A7C8MKU7_9PLEO|nr:hypothetical protein BDV95DRAFT_557940 [Massariosphaeria phaeospora]